MTHSLAVLSCVAACVLPVSPATGQRFKQLIVFGDSLSDVGNIKSRDGIPSSPPYYEGRVSNGPIWVDRLTDRLHLPTTIASELGGLNYAWAAATSGSVSSNFVPDLNEQIVQYLQANEPEADDLFVVWAGSNDGIFGQTQGAVAARAVGSNVRRLLRSGAAHLIVPNLPDRDGSSPYGQYGLDFNEELTKQLAELRNEFENADVVEFDYFTLQLALETNSEVFGYTYTHEPACRDCSVGEAENPIDIADVPEEYMFWDLAHPTTKTHQFIGDAAWNKLLIPQGDFDQDGAYSYGDIDLLQQAIRIGRDQLAFDTDGDWLLHSDDVDFWIRNLRKTYYGDTNLDGEFNSDDVIVALAAATFEVDVDAGWADRGLRRQLYSDNYFSRVSDN